MCLCVVIELPTLCVLMYDCPFSPLSPPVLTELQQADLITSEECRQLYDPNDVVEVQSGKFPKVLTKTADTLRRHGFERQSDFLVGKQTLTLIHVAVICCTVEPCTCKGLLRHVLLVFLTHTILCHS